MAGLKRETNLILPESLSGRVAGFQKKWPNGGHISGAVVSGITRRFALLTHRFRGKGAWVAYLSAVIASKRSLSCS